MKKKIIILISIILILIAAFICLKYCFKDKKSDDVKDENQIIANLNDDITVDMISSYFGPFVEDGSDENVENICCVTITNHGENDYQYIEFNITTDKKSYSFSASSVHNGNTMFVMNKDKLIFDKKEKVISAELTRLAEYVEAPSLHKEDFELYESSGVLNIKNISEKSFKKIVVYYKQTDENGFFGGITYRTVLESIDPGEIKQFNSEHFRKVVNIAYEQ